jgi:6-phosphogluconolactonase
MQPFFVGSYTHSSLDGTAQGISSCNLDMATGRMSLLGSTALSNPSYLAMDKSKRFLVAVQESVYAQMPAVNSFLIKPDFSLEPLSQQNVPGELPCYVAIDAENRWLTVANYRTGNGVLYPFENGYIKPYSDTVQHQGKSINADRQEGPHAHATIFNPENSLVFVTDLGLDEIKSYGFSEGKLELVTTLKITPGSGPRHFVFHPNKKHAFVLNELDSTVMVLRYAEGLLIPVQTLSAVPKDYLGDTWAAAIHISPKGKTVYTSNRGHDSIAVFNFDETVERLGPLQHISTGGQTPRDFSLDPTGKLLIVANQNSHNLVSFWIDEAGKLEATGHSLNLGSPVCVKMI